MADVKIRFLGDKGPLTRTISAIRKESEGIGAGFARAGGLLKSMRLPALGAAAAIFKMGQDAGKTADALFDMQDQTGVSTDKLQEMRFVADQAGVSQDFYANSVKEVIKAQDELRRGTGPTTDALNELGVAFKNADGSMRSAEAVTDDVFRSLAALEDPTLRAGLAQDIFKRKFEDVLPVLGLGTQEIDRLRGAAHDLGAVQSGEALDSANKYRQSMEKLQTVLQDLVNKIMRGVLPALTSAASGTLNVISGIEESVLRLRTALGGLPGEYGAVEGTSRSLRRELEAGVPVVEALANAYADVDDKSELTMIGIRALAEEAGASNVELQNAVQYALDHRDALELDRNAVANLVTQLAFLKGSIADSEDETGRLISRFGGIAGAAGDAAGAIDGIAAANRKLIDPLFALKDAQEKVKTAEDKVTQLRVEGKEGTAEYTGAMTDHIEALGDLNYAQEVFDTNAADIIETFTQIGNQAGYADEQIRRALRGLETFGGTPFSPGGDPFGVGGGGGPGAPGGGVLEGVDFQQPAAFPTINVNVDATGAIDPGGVSREVLQAMDRDLDIYNNSQRRPG